MDLSAVVLVDSSCDTLELTVAPAFTSVTGESVEASEVMAEDARVSTVVEEAASLVEDSSVVLVPTLAALPASSSSFAPFVAAFELPSEDIVVATVPVLDAEVLVRSAAPGVEVLLRDMADWTDVGTARVSRSTVDALLSTA